MAVDWLQYVAGYRDLIVAIGLDEAAAESHYTRFGRAEGRSLTAFDALLYGASNVDLARIYGTDTHALARHYINWGFSEGRVTSGFDPLLYGASSPDLSIRFGYDSAALLQHYLTTGAREGRPLATFDALEYGASHADLAKVYGPNSAALTRHYLMFGAQEGRSTTSFNALQYAAVNSDLATQFGLNETALRDHYLTVGAKAGLATSGFDAVGYLLSYSDLRGAGLSPDDALKHWIKFGRNEQRDPKIFGEDQSAHALGVGRVARSSFENVGDKDWYEVKVTAGQKISVALLTPGGTGTLLAGGAIEIYDSHGRLLGSNAVDGGVGFALWLNATATEAGSVYIVAHSTSGALAYDIAVAKIDAEPGEFIFTGGAIADVYIGSDAYNVMYGSGGDDLLGGAAGQDYFVGGAGADFMDGGAGLNQVGYDFSPAAVEIHLDGSSLGKGGDAEGDRLLNIVEVAGSAFADKLYGSAGHDILSGGGGYDHLEGLGGDDMLRAGEGGAEMFGGSGSDWFFAGSGADKIDGGDGLDRADYQSSETGVLIDLRSGYVGGGAAGDQLISIEAVTGSWNGNDVLATSGIGYESLWGYGGNDILIDRTRTGSAGSLAGNGGDDLLIGADIRGDEGNDTLVSTRENVVNSADGGPGADRYVIDPIENVQGSVFDFSLTITGFDGSDVIDLSRFRDEGGAALDLADIRAHSHGNLIDLSGFHTAGGDSVVGYIELWQQAGQFEPRYPFATDGLTGANFLFSGGINWLATIPAEFSFL